MKYYSEKTGKVYDSVNELERAEREYTGRDTVREMEGKSELYMSAALLGAALFAALLIPGSGLDVAYASQSDMHYFIYIGMCAVPYMLGFLSLCSFVTGIVNIIKSRGR